MLAIILVALGVSTQAPPRSGELQHPTTSMADTLPYGNRFDFPFTRDEYRRALLQVRPADEAELFVRALYEPEDDAQSVHMMDLDLLLLAALSDELAQRVTAFRPRLADSVEAVRGDSARFLQSWKKVPE